MDTTLVSFLNEIKKKKVIVQAFHDLRTRLPQGLYYHLPSHTEDVLHEALLFGFEDKLSPRQLELLGIAAAYHDTGYIDSLTENEPQGAARARGALEKTAEYSADDISQIVTMILDTKVHKTAGSSKQIPTTLLSRYLCDADMSNLGREDFLVKAKLLQQERRSKGEGEFLRSLEGLLTSHVWHTPAAKKLRTQGTHENLAIIKKSLGSTKAD